MKIRQGFVSNSSSSSFVIIVKPDDHKRAILECDPFVGNFMDDFYWDKGILFGQKIMSNMQYFDDKYQNIYGREDIPKKYKEYTVSGIVGEYEEQLKKIGADYLIKYDYY